MRRCSICGHEKPLTDFRYRGERYTGQPIYEYRCGVCEVRRKQMYRRRNRKAIYEYNRQYRAEILSRPVLAEAYRANERERDRKRRLEQKTKG